jgi:MFS family permease
VTGVARARYRDALRHRDLRLLIATFLVDQVGSWSYIVVISVYIFDRTHSTQWLAANAACRWAPSLLVASYGGVLADRYQRTTVMMVSALASAILMAGIAAVVMAGAPVAFVLAISAVASVALAPYQPAAGALTPEIVGEKDLAAANSIFSALQNLVVVIGPPCRSASRAPRCSPSPAPGWPGPPGCGPRNASHGARKAPDDPR